MKLLLLAILCIAAVLGSLEEETTSTPAPATTQKIPTEPTTTKKVTTRPATTKVTTTKQATTKKVTTRPATTKVATTKPATTKKVTTKPATTKKVTTKPVTTKAPTTKPTGSPLQCKKDFLKCVLSTPFWNRFQCVFKYKTCLWHLCPVRKCFVNIRICIRKASSLEDYYVCGNTWKKCMRSQRCPSYTYSF